MQRDRTLGCRLLLRRESKARRALYDFDEEALRPYFPVERVVEGMFTIFRTGPCSALWSSPSHGAPVWETSK